MYFGRLLPSLLVATRAGIPLPPPVAPSPPAHLQTFPGVHELSQAPGTGISTGSAVGGVGFAARRPTPRLRGTGTAGRSYASSTEAAEVMLTEILDSDSDVVAAMHYESELLRSPQVSNGDPSVAALLDLLEAAQPPPWNFDRDSLVGQWRLAYTDELAHAVQDEVDRHITDPSIGLSVSLLVDDTGAFRTTGILSLQDGERKVVSIEESLVQMDNSPMFSVVGPRAPATATEVTYLSKDILVMRKNSEFGEFLKSSGFSQAAPKTSVWRRAALAAEDEPIRAPSSLWRFGVYHAAVREQLKSQRLNPTRLSPLSSCKVLLGPCLIVAFAAAAAQRCQRAASEDGRTDEVVDRPFHWPDDSRFAVAPFVSDSVPVLSEASLTQFTLLLSACGLLAGALAASKEDKEPWQKELDEVMTEREYERGGSSGPSLCTKCGTLMLTGLYCETCSGGGGGGLTEPAAATS